MRMRQCPKCFIGRVLDCLLPLRFWCLPLEALQIVMVPKDAVGEMLFWTLLRLPLRFWSCLLGLLMEVLVSRKSDVSGISIITIEKKMNFWSSENQKKLNPSICKCKSLPCWTHWMGVMAPFWLSRFSLVRLAWARRFRRVPRFLRLW